MAGVSLVGQIGGGISSAIGGYMSASANKAMLEAQARIAEMNAQLAERNAQFSLDKGNKEVAALTLKAGQVKSSQRAAMAANGIDLSEGSAAELQASTEVLKDIDKNTLVANAVREAWGHRMERTAFENDAIMKRGAAEGISPGMALFGGLLTTATNVATSWYQFKRDGIDPFGGSGSTGAVGYTLGQVPGPSHGLGMYTMGGLGEPSGSGLGMRAGVGLGMRPTLLSGWR